MTENDMAKIARLVAFPGSPDDMMDTIAALRARVAKLEAALEDCKRYAEDHDDEWVPFRVVDALKDSPLGDS